MKTYLLLMLSAFFSNDVSPQMHVQDQIPDKIIKTLREKCPSITSGRWALKNNIYSVHFIACNKKGTAAFDTNGVWQSTETIIGSTRRLLLAVKNGFYKCEFSGWYIERITMYEEPDKTSYKFLVNDGNSLDGDHHDAFIQKYLVVFSPEGKLLSKIRVK